MKEGRILRIREACRDAGKKQKDLVPVLGITEASLSTAVAEDRFTARDLAKIAGALGVPVSDLFAAPSGFVALVREGGNTFAFDSREELAAWLAGGE